MIRSLRNMFRYLRRIILVSKVGVVQRWLATFRCRNDRGQGHGIGDLGVEGDPLAQFLDFPSDRCERRLGIGPSGQVLPDLRNGRPVFRDSRELALSALKSLRSRSLEYRQKRSYSELLG